MLLSVFSGVGGCGCPSLISVVLSGTASWVFMKGPPTSDSAAEVLTFWMTFARTRMVPLKSFPSLFPRKWNPPVLLRASGSTRYDASLSTFRIISDACYLICGSKCVAQ